MSSTDVCLLSEEAHLQQRYCETFQRNPFFDEAYIFIRKKYRVL